MLIWNKNSFQLYLITTQNKQINPLSQLVKFILPFYYLQWQTVKELKFCWLLLCQQYNK